MSTDLQVRQELVEMRLPSSSIKEVYAEAKSEACETPKTPRSLIPEARNCPPAPRKPRPAAISSCKRKQEELVLFEVVPREEVEAFFRQFEAMSKRRFVVLDRKFES